MSSKTRRSRTGQLSPMTSTHGSRRCPWCRSSPTPPPDSLPRGTSDAAFSPPKQLARLRSSSSSFRVPARAIEQGAGSITHGSRGPRRCPRATQYPSPYMPPFQHGFSSTRSPPAHPSVVQRLPKCLLRCGRCQCATTHTYTCTGTGRYSARRTWRITGSSKSENSEPR